MTVVLVSRVLVLVVLVVLLGSLLWLPARVDVAVEGSAVVVRPRGFDMLWCLRRKVVVPLASIALVRAVPRNEAPRPQLRWRSSVPARVVAGSYGTGDGRTFWDVRRAERVLVISCRLGSEYKTLVLEV